MNAEDIKKYIQASTLSIIAKPNSSKSEVKCWDEEKKALRVDIAAEPEKGKANIEVVKFFARLLKRKVSIIKGLTSKQKVLKIA
jgi:uncharacterized protein (TIGR00251 family)